MLFLRFCPEGGLSRAMFAEPDNNVALTFCSRPVTPLSEASERFQEAEKEWASRLHLI